MINNTLIAILSFLMIGGMGNLNYGMESTVDQEEGHPGPTGFILDSLRYGNQIYTKTRWCKNLLSKFGRPLLQASGKEIEICDDLAEDEFYKRDAYHPVEAEFYEKKFDPNEMHQYMVTAKGGAYSGFRKLHSTLYFSAGRTLNQLHTMFWVRGYKAIERFEKNLGGMSDKWTKCNVFHRGEDDDGNLQQLYSCETENISYDDFFKFKSRSK